MPMISGNYFSEKEISRDLEFLKSQNVDEKQASAISAYFLQRISNAVWLSCFIGAGTGALIITLLMAIV